ncbi:MAG: hypothetical protein KGJ13_11385, partial [Patescibacteria group bacterium]|nr:hypothetical protein [Patescibacteria group bacterium]
AARKLFAERAKAGTLGGKRKAARKKNPIPKTGPHKLTSAIAREIARDVIDGFKKSNADPREFIAAHEVSDELVKRGFQSLPYSAYADGDDQRTISNLSAWILRNYNSRMKNPAPTTGRNPSAAFQTPKRNPIKKPRVFKENLIKGYAVIYPKTGEELVYTRTLARAKEVANAYAHKFNTAVGIVEKRINSLYAS